MAQDVHYDFTITEKTQNDKVTTLNAALERLSEGTARKLAFTFASDANDSLTDDETHGYWWIEIQNGTITAARDLTVADDTEKPFVVTNLEDFIVTFKTSTGTGIEVGPGETRYLYADGTDVVEPGITHHHHSMYQFGNNGNITGTALLASWLGSEHCIMRDGSITGVSVALNVSVEGTPGNITINVRINGSTVFSATAILTSGTGLYKQADVQLPGIDNVSAEDTLEVQVEFGPATAFAGTIDECVVNVEQAYNA